MSPVVDKKFIRELCLIASELEVEWDNDLERFVIYYKSPRDGQRHKILEVKNNDGSFRPLDGRTLELLRKCDMSTKVTDVKYLLSEQFKKMKAFKEKLKANHKEEQLRRGRDLKSKWVHAADNADKGIIYNSQLDNKIIYSLPSSRTLII
jgi:hypothetical protein